MWRRLEIGYHFKKWYNGISIWYHFFLGIDYFIISLYIYFSRNSMITCFVFLFYVIVCHWCHDLSLILLSTYDSPIFLLCVACLSHFSTPWRFTRLVRPTTTWVPCLDSCPGLGMGLDQSWGVDRTLYQLDAGRAVSSYADVSLVPWRAAEWVL